MREAREWPDVPPEIVSRSVDRVVWVVELRGDCDVRGAAGLARSIDHGVSTGHDRFVFDVSAATLLDCASLSAIVGGLAPAGENLGSAVVVGARGTVERLLTLTPIGTEFARFATRAAALSHVRTTRA